MRRICMIALCLLFSLPAFSFPVEAVGTNSTSIAVPTQSLTGSSNSQKVYYLDIPSGVSSSSIKSSTLKYNGTNSLVSLAVESGKIKVTLNGVQQTKIIQGVVGYRASWGEEYVTQPGNSIWRYSDGVRWQVNKFNIQSNSNDYFITRGTGATLPYGLPLTAGVVTRSNISIDYIKWYNGSANDVINSDDIIQNTINLNDFSKPNDATVDQKNGEFIISYSVPKSHLFISEDVPESISTGPYVVGRRYILPFTYHYLADAKVTSYNYAGNITFDYNLPTDAELNGTVSILKPNPNPTKYENKDVPVQLSLRGELLKYTNTSNISEWVFYAKEKGKDNTLQTKKDYSKTLNSNRVFDFTIPKSRVSSDNFKQEYELTVIVRFSNPVTTQSGTITYLQQPLSAMVEVYKNAPSVTYPSTPPAPAPKGQPPVAVLMVPPIVKAGEDVVARGGGSYDPDGEIKNYFFEAPGSISLPTPTESTSTFWYPIESIGENTVGLTVVDNDMMTGSTGGFIKVIHPIPDAKIEITGTKKQNRKVILTSKSTSPFYYPLDQNKTRITIEAMSGGTNADIKYAGTLSGITANPVLFKKPGIYRASIYVENTLGYSATDVVNFEIVPDEPPVVYFSMPGRAFRDPLNGNQAVIAIDDMSYSPDGDIIDQRLWEYRYDSDNDGNFNEEAWVIFSNENKDRLNLTVTEVGKYEIRHTAYETFGQPTIEAFITSADRKYADSSSQNAIEKIVDVKNRAPQADWSW